MAQTDIELARDFARQFRAYRVSPRGASMTLRELAQKSGVGLTPLRRFEITGGITLKNLIALLRALGLVNRISDLIPEPDSPSPMEVLRAAKAAPVRVRALRKPAARS